MKYLFYYCFFILVILIFAYINSFYSFESFTPEIRGFYRPIVRNTRLTAEGFYERTHKNIQETFEGFYKGIGLKKEKL